MFDTAYFLAWVLVFVFGTSLQKFCQAFVANRLGDPSSANKGRLTLNPLVHHEPLGLVFGFLLSVNYPAVAWGKPLELNNFRLRGGRLGRVLVAAIGPLTFLVVAFLLWIASKGYILGVSRSDFVAKLLVDIIQVALILCAFNLIPIYPFDGYEIIKSILPADWEPRLQWVEQYGILILVVLVLILPFFLQVNILFRFYVSPIVNALANLLGIGINL